MRLGAWKSYISDTGKLNMSESKRERERESQAECGEGAEVGRP
jgi:hypothetical protein